MIGIISHDAGGAEILSSYVLHQKNLKFSYALEGPAINIFEQKLGSLKIENYQKVVKQSSKILCSTSWESNLEFNAIKLSNSFGKYSVALLDHWVNYKERFTRLDQIILPNAIWVSDSIAKDLAEKIFINNPVRLINNFFLEDIKKELILNRLSNNIASSSSILYVCEPKRKHAQMQHGDETYWGYTEETALRYFLSNIHSLRLVLEKIIIRPHPSESANKYHWLLNEFRLPIEFSNGKSLVEDVSASDIIVGCESMALVVGLLAEKRVISSIPPGGRGCSLPHRDIEIFQNIVHKK